ncbi:hypothetical protein PANA5342_3041 [Pantoea ananatis LMG 5342]|nr:hypothetical protein PANA5342_3041 [Pantoea ananatis LMG 5342]
MSCVGRSVIAAGDMLCSEDGILHLVDIAQLLKRTQPDEMDLLC